MSERRSVARGLFAALRADRASWRDRTFARWLAANRQPPRVIERFWAPIVVSACNLSVERLAASVALHVFQEAFLTTARGARIALPSVPLADLYAPAVNAVNASGGEVRLGAPVARVDERLVTLAGGAGIECERVVLAVPPERVCAILDDSIRARDRRIEPLRGIAHSPILGVHLTLDRVVLDAPHAALVACATHWLFNKGDTPEGGQRLHAVVSAADEWVGLDEPAIIARVLRDVESCFPAARGARALAARTVKERRATFAATPAFERVRPSATSDASTIVLAGDYTDTGWPATMESAARSGYLAAAGVLGKPRAWALAPAQEPARLAAMLGGSGLARSLARAHPLSTPRRCSNIFSSRSRTGSVVSSPVAHSTSRSTRFR